MTLSDNDVGTVNIVIDVNGYYTSGSVGAELPHVQVYWKSPIANGFTPLSVSRVFDLAAGESKSLSLICFGAGNNSTTIYGPQVTAIFTPAS